MGLGTTQFESSIDALFDIRRVLFDREFPEGKLKSFEISPSCITADRSLVLSNRYFTKKSEGPQMRDSPFPNNVDPVGILARNLGNGLIHTEENDVTYLRRASDMLGQHK